MSNGVHLLTGHQTTNHISASDEALTNIALLTDKNVIVADSKNVTCTADGSTGTLTIGAFSALFSGRKITASETTGTYTRPTANTTYRRVIVGLLYTKDTSNGDVEDCSLVVYTSESETSSQNAAASMSTDAPEADSIGTETTSAFFEMFDLIVNQSGIVTKKVSYAILPSRETIKEQQDETAEDVTALKNWKTSVNSSISTLNSATDTLSSDVSGLKSWKTNTVTGQLAKIDPIGTRVTTLETWKDEADAKLITVTNLGAFIDSSSGYNKYYTNFTASYDFFIVSVEIKAANASTLYSRETFIVKYGLDETHAAAPVVSTGTPQTIIIPLVTATHTTVNGNHTLTISAGSSVKINHSAVLALEKETEHCNLSNVSIYGVKL